MSMYQKLCKMAEDLEAQADEIEASGKEVAEAQKTAAATQSKTAAAEQEAMTKEAEEKKAAIGQLAKTAAAAVKEAGLISTPEQADAFAAQLLDHDVAIQKLAQLTQHVAAPKLGSAVVDPDIPAAESADDVWMKHASAALSRLNIG